MACKAAGFTGAEREASELDTDHGSSVRRWGQPRAVRESLEGGPA